MQAHEPGKGQEEFGCGPSGPGRIGWWWWIVPVVVLSGVLIVGLLDVVLRWPAGVAPGDGPAPFLWPIFPLGFLALLFVGFFLFRWAAWGGRGWGDGTRGSRHPARELLQWRYARGELTTEQFRQMSRELDGQSRGE